jgi:hypothetical protein
LAPFLASSDGYIGNLEVFTPPDEHIWRASMAELLLSPPDIPAAHE